MYMRLVRELGDKGVLTKVTAVVLAIEIFAMGIISYMSLIIISGFEEMFFDIPTGMEIALWFLIMGVKRTVLDFITIGVLALIEEL